MNQTEEILERMKEDIGLRGYSWHTQDYYVRYARKFLEYAGRPANELGDADIRAYLNYLIYERGLAKGTVNAHNGALRFLFEVTLDKAVNHKQIPRMKEHHEAPEILTKEEIRRLLDHAHLLHHKAILMTIYGGGLRASEACNLKITDIDSESMRIFVRDGKGGKDRYTLLSQANLELLREYWRKYRPSRPEGWLFLNHKRSGHAKIRMVQAAFINILAASGVQKEVTVHSLRASFATHLLEDGVDVFTLQRLLGHANLSTINRYLGVTRFAEYLKSPLDSLPKKRGRKPKASAPDAAHA